jgi:hypothetical protein
MNRQQKQHLLETGLILLVLAALLVWVLPRFAGNQRLREIRLAERKLEVLAKAFAEDEQSWQDLHQSLYGNQRWITESNAYPPCGYKHMDTSHINLSERFQVDACLPDDAGNLEDAHTYYMGYRGVYYKTIPEVDIDYFAVYVWRGDPAFISNWGPYIFQAKEGDEGFIDCTPQHRLLFEVSNGLDSQGFIYRDSVWAGWKVPYIETEDGTKYMPFAGTLSSLTLSKLAPVYRLPWHRDFRVMPTPMPTVAPRVLPETPTESPIIEY